MSSATIVIPCFNEERRLPVREFEAFAEGHEWCRFLFVDDGSTDGTRPLLESLAARIGDGASVLALERNVGKAEAVRRGILHALGSAPDRFGYWDADLATPLPVITEFRELLESSPGTDLVMGARVRLLGREIHRGGLRHYLGRCFATAASVLLGLPVYDTQCGAKLFRRTPATQSAFERPFVSRWIFDVEILARLKDELGSAALVDGRIVEFPLQRWTDVGDSKLRLRDGLRAFVDLARIAFREKRPRRDDATSSPDSEPNDAIVTPCEEFADRPAAGPR